MTLVEGYEVAQTITSAKRMWVRPESTHSCRMRPCGGTVLFPQLLYMDQRALARTEEHVLQRRERDQHVLGAGSGAGAGTVALPLDDLDLRGQAIAVDRDRIIGEAAGRRRIVETFVADRMLRALVDP